MPRRGSDRPGFNRDFPDNVSETGSARGGARRFEGDGKVRDFGNWERKGPLSPVAGVAGREGGRPRSNEGSGFRKSSPAWGEGRSQDGSRPPRREFQERPERPERTPTAAEMDNQWRARMRPDPPAAPAAKEPSAPSSPVATPAAPAVRPKLNLQKRTVSENVQSPPPSAGGDSKASPFGAARPINTAAREQEVVAKRERARKDAEEKAKAEKAEKQRQSKEKAKVEKSATSDSNGAKETDPDAPKKSNFEVLRRAADEGAEVNEAEETKEESTAGKEQQTKEATDSKTNGSWRKAEPAAAEADEEGWSTVSTNKRNKGRGRGY